MKSVSTYLTGSSFSSFSDLLRLQVLKDWVERPGVDKRYLKDLDAFQSRHLQAVISSESLGILESKLEPNVVASAQFQRVKNLCLRVEELLAPLFGPAQPLEYWLEAILATLKILFGPLLDQAQESSFKRKSHEALKLISELFSEIGDNQGAQSQVITCKEALEMLLHLLSACSLEPLLRQQSFQMLGWLELQLDDAACSVIVGFNEGNVPSSPASDGFLPDTLRRILGLSNEQSRYARDLFFFCAICKSKQALKVICARSQRGRSALLPSRLLLAAEPLSLAKRLLDFYKEVSPPVWQDNMHSQDNPTWRLPQPIKGALVLREMSLSAFESYLSCPYRFYLRYVLGIKPYYKQALELDPLNFGEIAHEVLRRFAFSEVSDSQNAKEIAEYFSLSMQAIFEQRFSASAYAVVQMQFRQLSLRLEAFAEWQAAWAAQGWRIVEAELNIQPQQVALEFKDSKGYTHSMGLSGRIDRIDRNIHSESVTVFDYKISEQAASAESYHRNKDKTWRKFQLPAYYYALRTLGKVDSADLALLNLPSDRASVGASFAAWSEAELEQAIDSMRCVARLVHEEIFWPPVNIRADIDDYEVLFPSGLRSFELPAV